MAGYNQNPYTVEAGNDYSSGLSGLSNTIANVRQAKIQEAEQQRKQDIYDRAQKRFTEVQSAAQKAFSSQNPDEVAKIAVQYPEITQMLQQATGLKEDMQKKEASGFLRQLNAASPDQRDAIYQQRIQSIKDRGGDPSHSIQSYADYKADPEGEILNTRMLLAGADPEGYKAFATEQEAKAKVQAEKDKAAREEAQFNRAEAGRNQRAYARAAATANGSSAEKQTAHQKDFNQWKDMPEGPEKKAFGQAAGFVSKEGRELAPGVQERLAKTIDSAVAADNNIGRFNSLADEIDKSNLTGGLLGGSWAEKAKELTGDQDAATNLRKEFAQVRASQASANLPPGSASDADVALALGPIPSDNANKKQIVSYLRGQAKLSKLASDFNNFKADYISVTGGERGMLQAWKKQGGAGGSAGGAKPSPGQPAAPASSGGWEIVK